MKSVHDQPVHSEPPFAAVRRFISNLRIFPKNHDFFGYFRQSSDNIVAGTEFLCQLIATKDDRAPYLEKMKAYELAGDKITREMINLLHQTFLTPLDRSDMHNLIVTMDDILDLANFVGNRMTRYGITEMPPEMLSLAQILHKCAKELALAIKDLENLNKSNDIHLHCHAVNQLEKQADEQIGHAIGELFTKSWDPYEVIKLKELLENLEYAVDTCQDVANLVEAIVIRNA